ncbi:MAG: cation-translocating P-type ATPase [Planctomycetia bacterium]|nr:MAG: cation-translocating P-type ATPase [Planctomycetia bacterium]
MPRPETDSISIPVSGMHCAGCTSAVEAAVRRVPGVVNAVASLPTGRVLVQTRAGPPPRDLIRAAIRSAGYDTPMNDATRPGGAGADAAEASTARQQADLIRLLIAVGLGAPILVTHVLPAHGQHHGAWLPLQAGLATAVLWVAGAEMFRGALRAAGALRANMDTLVALGTITAYAAGVVGAATGRPEIMHFDAAVMIVLLVALGKHLEQRARGQAGESLRLLAARVPQTAWIIDADGAASPEPVDRIVPGMRFRLIADQPVPVDGRITSGAVSIDESALTGESLPAERGAGETVRSGTRVVAGTAEATALATGADSSAARIARLAEMAQASRTPWQRLADRVAAVFVPLVLALGVSTAVFHVLRGAGADAALERTVAVLVVACPCALGLAIPTAVLVSVSTAARRGILVRTAGALEAAARVGTVLIDKTGTLTLGRPRLTRIEPLAGISQMELLRLGAAAGRFSEHPLSQAIATAAQDAGLALATPARFEARAGLGVLAQFGPADQATPPQGEPSSSADRAAAPPHNGAAPEGAAVGASTLLLGSARWLRDQGVTTAAWEGRADALTADGSALVWLARNAAPIGVFVLHDPPHPDAAAALERLRALGLRTQILSGDRRSAVAVLAEALRVDAFDAELSPEEKVARVQEAGRGGRPVAMVGDGINDAPALAVADVGIAIGTGADIAREASDICLVGASPRGVAEVLELARRSVRVMRQNLVWAFGYNALMLPLAFFANVPPAVAAAAMSISSLTVVLNSLRLARWRGDRLRPETAVAGQHAAPAALHSA